MLISSCWGVLSQSNTMNKTEQQIEDEDIDVGDIDHKYDIIDEIETKNSKYFVLINNDNPYRYNIRLKCWLTAYGRNFMANLSYPHLKHLVRVHTDNLTFDKPINFNDPYFLPEEKTTGLIHWENNGKYKKLSQS